LHAKAKGSPSYRFYALYDKVYRADVLWHAYGICQSNGGAPGVDGRTFEDIEKYGRQRWLDELAEELRMKRYRPEAVRAILRGEKDSVIRQLPHERVGHPEIVGHKSSQRT
jgi:hypothetical protein